MFTKAFRALNAGSRDKERGLDDPYIDLPSSRRRVTGPESAPRQLQEPITFDGLHISDSDSDEYGLPQVRKSNLPRQDSHRRTTSREQAEVEYRCPGCGEQYRFKHSEHWPPCKYCHVKPPDHRRRQNARPVLESTAQRQVRTPRQLEESFRSMYRRLGVIMHDEAIESNTIPNTHSVQPVGRASENSAALDSHDGSATSPAKVMSGRNPRIDATGFGSRVQDSSRGPPIRQPSAVPNPHTPHSAPRGPPTHGLSMRAEPFAPSGHEQSLRTPQGFPRPTSRGSPMPSNMDLSPRKRMLREPNIANTARPRLPPSDPRSRAKQLLIDQFQADFRSLYGDAEYLNSNYCTSVRPKINKRSLSEGSNVSHKSHEEDSVRPVVPRHGSETRPAPRRMNTGKPLPTVPAFDLLYTDSKALLAGQLHDIVSPLADTSEGRPIERSSTVAKKSTYQTSPHVNYSELHAYHSILNRYTLDVDHCLSLVSRNEDDVATKSANKSELVHFIANLLVSCLDVMFELLTAAQEEPNAPQAARYLSIVLSTPWLLRPLTPLASEFQRRHDELRQQGAPEVDGRLEEQARLLLLEQSSSKKARSSLREQILALIFGRISHLPEAVQHVFARWFANMPVNIYVDILKAVQASNVTYVRQIPVQKHGNTEEGRQLRDRRLLSEVLGGVNIDIRNFGDDVDTLLPSYSKRRGAWKLRASCQTMQLLVVANDIRSDTMSRYAQNRPSDDRYKPLPVDYFYTSLLEPAAGRLDVAMDFELWESRKDKFAICQYPFLLTLGSKVAILEYENERRKKQAVRQEWHASKGMSADPYFHLPIRREHIIADSFKLIREAVGSFSGVTLKKLRVHFEGEEAVDAGGPQKEWFLILTQELFKPELGLFYLTDSGNFWFHSSCNKPNEYFELVGAVFGLAIYNQTPLFAPFPPFLFKKLAAAAPKVVGPGNLWRQMWRPTLQDYAELSPDFARVLKQGLADPSVMEGLTFETPMWQHGKSVYQPLMPGGSEKEITPANIDQYVERTLAFVLRDSIKNQFTAFARGFHSICGGNALSLFRGEELELLVRGAEDFDLDTLRAAVRYDNWKQPGTDKDLESEDSVKRAYPVVRMFWDYFERADMTERRRILRFITGTDRLPPAGIVNLVIKVSRQQMEKGAFRYPSARTCFNQILLPDCFRAQAVFDKVFRNALDMAGTGFGLK